MRRSVFERDPLRKGLLMHCEAIGCDVEPVIDRSDDGVFRIRHGRQGAGTTIDAGDVEDACTALYIWLATLHD